jgi:hypothetical protein
MTTPTTEAGRRLLDAAHTVDNPYLGILPNDFMRDAVLAIEAEARADLAAVLRDCERTLEALARDELPTGSRTLIVATLRGIRLAIREDPAA